MIRRSLLGVALPVCIAFQTATVQSAFAQAPVAGLVGVIRDSGTGQPVPEAQVVAHNINSGANFSGVTRTNGSFTMPLEPGYYSVAVTKSGFGRYSSTVKVSAKKT